METPGMIATHSWFRFIQSMASSVIWSTKGNTNDDAVCAQYLASERVKDAQHFLVAQLREFCTQPFQIRQINILIPVCVLIECQLHFLGYGQLLHQDGTWLWKFISFVFGGGEGT